MRLNEAKLILIILSDGHVWGDTRFPLANESGSLNHSITDMFPESLGFTDYMFARSSIICWKSNNKDRLWHYPSVTSPNLFPNKNEYIKKKFSMVNVRRFAHAQSFRIWFLDPHLHGNSHTRRAPQLDILNHMWRQLLTCQVIWVFSMWQVIRRAKQ